MTYEELKIQLDIGDPVEVLNAIGEAYNNTWLVVCDEGDCHLFDNYGKEHDVWYYNRLTCVIPSSIKKIVVPDGIVSIAATAFFSYTHLKSIKMPDSVKHIGSYAFFNCKQLESIEILGSVKGIGYQAFMNCPRMKKIAFKGMTMEQVKAMTGYPWGIADESIIKCKS